MGQTGAAGSVADLRGIFPIVYTPFDAAGEIDWEDIEHLVDYMIANGTHGLAPCGGASETGKMGLSERMLLAERTNAFARGRVPVVVGVSTGNTADSVELARHAADLGAPAVFLTPLAGGTSSEALAYHYGRVARAVPIGVMVQDASVVVPPSQFARLVEQFPNVCYVKEEAADAGHRITELKRLRPDAKILSGGSYLIEDLHRGAQGAIPGCVGVGDLSRAYDRYAAGDVVGARDAFDHFTPLSFWRRQFPLIGAKEVLRRIGVFKAAYLREPAGTTLDEQDHHELATIMDAWARPTDRLAPLEVPLQLRQW